MKFCRDCRTVEIDDFESRCESCHNARIIRLATQSNRCKQCGGKKSKYTKRNFCNTCWQEQREETAYDPTPEEIAQECADIQSTWSESEFKRRSPRTDRVETRVHYLRYALGE